MTSDAIAAERSRVGGDPEKFDFARVLKIQDFALPGLGESGVRIRVLVASLEHNVLHAALADTVDIAMRRGGSMVPGNCFVGEVVETGATVTRFRPGDVVVAGVPRDTDRFGYPERVWGYDQPDSIGCYAEETVVEESQVELAPLDCGLSIWELAATPLRAATAFHLWRRGEGIFRLKVPREKLPRLNVLAFGGGTSEFFLMLARSEGHRSFYCSANPTRRAALQQRGIEPVDQEPFDRFTSPAGVRAFARQLRRMTHGQGVHVVCDMFRGPVSNAGLAVLSRQGVNVSAGWQLGTQLEVNAAALCLRQITIDCVHFETVEGCRAVRGLFGSVFRPVLHPEIYAFEDLPRAAAELHHSRQQGIPVVRVAPKLPDSVHHMLGPARPAQGTSAA